MVLYALTLELCLTVKLTMLLEYKVNKCLYSIISGRSMVINVEYNQLDPLLRATGHPDGDVNNETGYSPFPGNINQVFFMHIEIIFLIIT